MKPKKRTSKKKTNTDAKLPVDEKEIKYKISNTELPVIITNNGQLLFDIDEADQKKLLAKDPKKIEEYRHKIDLTMEYLFLEGFLNITEESGSFAD